MPTAPDTQAVRKGRRRKWCTAAMRTAQIMGCSCLSYPLFANTALSDVRFDPKPTCPPWSDGTCSSSSVTEPRSMAMQDQVNTDLKPKGVPWNKGKLTGAKPPLRPKHVWSIRTELQIEGRVR